MSYKCGILIVTILALLSFTANASVDSELKGFVASIPALDKIFTSDVAINLIGQRAEQVVEHQEHLYAVVLFPVSLERPGHGLGLRYCKAALGRPLRELWVARLQQKFEYLTLAVANRLLSARALNYRFIGLETVEYSHSGHWRGASCYVALSNVQIDFPDMPSATEVDQATYDQAKEAFDQGNQKAALDLFQSLSQRSSEHFSNLIPYLIILLHDDHPDLAEALQAGYLDLANISDPDAKNEFMRYLDELGPMN